MGWYERDDGMVESRARLPKDEAALVIAAIDTAKDQFTIKLPQPTADLDQKPRSEPEAAAQTDNTFALQTTPLAGRTTPWTTPD